MAKSRMIPRFLACIIRWHLVSLIENGNIVGEESSFALINSDMPITYPKQYAKMAVEYVSLDAQKIG